MRKKVCIVILNYMTFEMTIDLVNQLRTIGFEEDIVIVDNASSNESYSKLESASEVYDFILLKSEKNLGYAAGNNIGIYEAIKLGYETVLIANNDIIIKSVNDIYAMYEILGKNNKVGAVTPKIFDNTNKELEQHVFRPRVWDWTFGIVHYKNKCISKTQHSNKDFLIYKPQGCCMMLKTDMLQKINYLDTQTFLYFEEDILAEKMILNGYKCWCCKSAAVIHNHSVTTDACLKKLKKLRIYIKSQNIYMKRYRKWNIFARFFCSIIKGLTIWIK